MSRINSLSNSAIFCILFVFLFISSIFFATNANAKPYVKGSLLGGKELVKYKEKTPKTPKK